MSIVNVDTEALKEFGNNVHGSLQGFYGPFIDVYNIPDYGIASLISFKRAVTTRFNIVEQWTNIIDREVDGCIAAIEQTDDSIGAAALQIKGREQTIESAANNELVCPLDFTSLPTNTIYDSTGAYYFEAGGLYVKETFCPDELKHSDDLKFLILKMGYDAGYWVREDGVQMWGEDVMYATAIPHQSEAGIEGYNPYNTPWRRGDVWYGTSGPGRIVGLCQASEYPLQDRLYYNNRKVDLTYDVYTRWGKNDYGADDPLFISRWSNKEEAYATRNVIDNPPLDPSERYYQPQEVWVKVFERPAAREYIPDGVVDWNNPNDWRNFDWVSYFQVNNPNGLQATSSIVV